MNNNILITAAGRRVSLVKSFITELRKQYPTAKVVAADMDTQMAPACHVADEAVEIVSSTHPNYIQNLIHLCKEYAIGMVVPTIDTELEVLAENRTMLIEQGIIPIISSVDFIETCNNKTIAFDFFTQRGFQVPKAIDKSNLSFPLFVKPKYGSRSIDAQLIENADDMPKRMLKDEDLLFTEYLDHDTHDEYTVDLYYSDKGELKCAVPRKRIEVRDGEVSKGLTIKNQLVASIKQKLGIIKGARGCITAQFFMNKQDDSIYGIEINPRFGGGYPLSYHAGANYSKWLIDEYFKGKQVDYFDTWEENLLMLRYDAEVMVRHHKN